VQTSVDADFALNVWLSAQDDEGLALLRDLLLDGTVADEQRSRLWRQAITRSQAFGKGFFIELVPKALAVQNSESTSAAIFDSEQTLDKLMHDGEDRSSLARGLMSRFHDFDTGTIKGGAGAIANRFVGNSALKGLSVESLTASDLEILSGTFGHSKELDRIGDAIRKHIS